MFAALSAVLTMGALAVSPAVPLHRVDEKSWFHIPGVEDFRLQKIARAENRASWPFSIDEGYLMCVFVTAQRAVYFTPIPDESEVAPLVAVVSSNPFQLAFGNLSARGLIRRDLPIETLMGMMAPLEAVGRRLCDQPRGTKVGPGEL